MKDWKEIDEDLILNYGEAHTGTMAQYERIMSRKLRNSIILLTESFNKQTGDLKKSIDDFNVTSSRLSSKLYWLNFTLVFLTIILVIFGIPAIIWQLRHW